MKWESGQEEESKKTGWRLFETYQREYPISPNEKPEAVEVKAEIDLRSKGLPKVVCNFSVGSVGVQCKGAACQDAVFATTYNNLYIAVLIQIRTAGQCD